MQLNKSIQNITTLKVAVKILIFFPPSNNYSTTLCMYI